MALETVDLALDQSWRLVSNAASGPFKAAVSQGAALFSIGDAAPADPAPGLASSGVDFAALPGKVWARGVGGGAVMSVVRTADAGNPAITLLPALTLSASSFASTLAAGAEIATIGGRVAGDRIESLSPNDGRIVLSTDGTKLLRGPTATTDAPIRIELARSHPLAPSSPQRVGFTLAVAVPALAISGMPGLHLAGRDFRFEPAVSGGSGTRSFALTGALPAGLSFSAQSGAIFGWPTTPGQTLAGTITVTDATGSAALPVSLLIRAPGDLPALPLPVGARIAAIGDSQIGYNNTFGGPVGNGASAYTGSLKAALSTGLGFIAFAKALDPRFRFETWYDTADPRGQNFAGANQGLHGSHFEATTTAPTGILDRLGPLLARRPDLLVVEGGVNPISSGADQSAAFVISRLDMVLRQALEAGVWTILMTIYPRGDWIASGSAGLLAKQATIDEVNAWVRAQAGRRGVAAIMDAEAILRPGGAFDATLFRDQVHLTPKGALAVAEQSFLPILRALVPAGTTFDKDPTVSNLLPAALYNMAGTTGTNSGFGANGQTFAGQVATGLTLSCQRNFSAVASKEVIAGSLEQQRIVLTPGGATAQNYYEGSLSGFIADEPFTAGQWYQAFMEVDLQNAESLSFLGLVGGHRSAANAVLTQTIALARESSSDYARGGLAGNRTLWLQTEPFRNDDAAATKLAFTLFWTGNKLSSQVLTMAVRRPIIRRVADPRPGWGYPAG